MATVMSQSSAAWLSGIVLARKNAVIARQKTVYTAHWTENTRSTRSCRESHQWTAKWMAAQAKKPTRPWLTVISLSMAPAPYLTAVSLSTSPADVERRYGIALRRATPSPLAGRPRSLRHLSLPDYRAHSAV